MLQKDVAKALSVNHWTLINWEQDRAEPEIRLMPRILQFLGYYSFSEPQTFAETLVKFRRREGLSRKRLAAKLSIDPATVSKWEDGDLPYLPSHLTVLVSLGIWPMSRILTISSD